MMIIKWNYGKIENPIRVKIEKSSVFDGPYTQISEVDYPKVEYNDDAGTSNDYYRFKIIYGIKVDKKEIMFSSEGESIDLEHFSLVDDSVIVSKGDETLITLIEGVDYSVDYNNGIITHIPTGVIGVNETVYVSFMYEQETNPTLPKKDESPELCKVYGYIYNVSGIPVGGENLFIRVLKIPSYISEFILDDIPTRVEVGEDGYFEIGLIKNSVVKIECLRAGLKESFVVPNLSSCKIIDLIK